MLWLKFFTVQVRNTLLKRTCSFIFKIQQRHIETSWVFHENLFMFTNMYSLSVACLWKISQCRWLPQVFIWSLVPSHLSENTGSHEIRPALSALHLFMHCSPVFLSKHHLYQNTREKLDWNKTLARHTVYSQGHLYTVDCQSEKNSLLYFLIWP